MFVLETFAKVWLVLYRTFFLVFGHKKVFLTGEWQGNELKKICPI